MSIKRFLPFLKFNEVRLKRTEHDDIINAADLGSRKNKFFFSFCRERVQRKLSLSQNISHKAFVPHLSYVFASRRRVDNLPAIKATHLPVRSLIIIHGLIGGCIRVASAAFNPLIVIFILKQITYPLTLCFASQRTELRGNHKFVDLTFNSS